MWIPFTRMLFKIVAIALSLWLLGMKGSYLPSNQVSGRVYYPKAKSPLIQRIKHYKDQHGHAQAPKAEDGVVIFHPLDFKPSLSTTPNAIITQKDMTFFPEVLPITRGSTIYILNEDNEYHNVYSRTPGATFNIGRRPPGHMYPQKIGVSGVIRVFCDIHEHMEAYILSLDTPYFTRVEANGRYQLDGLPDGKYRIELFHPEYPAYEGEIQLLSGQALSFDIQWP